MITDILLYSMMSIVIIPMLLFILSCIAVLIP